MKYFSKQKYMESENDYDIISNDWVALCDGNIITNNLMYGDDGITYYCKDEWADEIKNIFLICPVRNATEEQKEKMGEYIHNLEEEGNVVYYPARDTNQVDSTSYRICTDNRTAIENSDEVHIFWDINSLGSLFDLGMIFALRKKVVIANPESVDTTTTKSFTNMLTYWSKL